MSYFGATLKSLMQANRVTGIKIQREAGIHPSVVSRWTNRGQRFVADADLQSLCRVVCRDDLERATLIVAHLQDKCQGRAAKLIHITIKNRTKAKPRQTTIASALDFLQAVAAEKPALEKILISIARNEGFTD